MNNFKQVGNDFRFEQLLEVKQGEGLYGRAVHNIVRQSPQAGKDALGKAISEVVK